LSKFITLDNYTTSQIAIESWQSLYLRLICGACVGPGSGTRPGGVRDRGGCNAGGGADDGLGCGAGLSAAVAVSSRYCRSSIIFFSLSISL